MSKHRIIGGERGQGFAVLGTLLIIGVLVLVIGLWAYQPVKVGTVQIVTRFGGLTGRVLEPGLNWITPGIDSTTTIHTRLRSYETSDNPGQTGADHQDWFVNAQTVDGQQIDIKYTVLFRIPAENAVDVFTNIGDMEAVVENVIKANSRNLVRLIAQSYTAEQLYSGDTFEYEEHVRRELEVIFAEHGIIIEDFLVRKIEFDEEYIRSIENQQIAQENIETERYNAEAALFTAEREANEAAGRAEATRLQSEADNYAARQAADAEAYAIEVQGAALRANPEVIQWQFVNSLTNVQWGFLPELGDVPLIYSLPDTE